MVQVLPSNPSFGTLLSQHLGTALGDIGQGYIEGQQNKKKKAGVTTLLQQFGITPEQAEQIAASGIEAKDILAHGDKLQPQAQGGQQGLQEAFNEMGKLLSEDAAGIGISPLTAIGLNPKGSENRAYFDRLATRVESALLPLVSKGALSKERFQYILDQLPKSSDRQRVILGKLKGLAKDLNLDPSILENVAFSKEDSSGKSSPQSSSSFAKPPSGYVLVQPPNGSAPVQIPRSELKKAEAAGGKLIR